MSVLTNVCVEEERCLKTAFNCFAYVEVKLITTGMMQWFTFVI